MELIPLVYVKNRKTIIEKEGGPVVLDDNLEKEREIYFLDIDGIEKNRPNLCLYQKISERLEIWVDAGSRVLGDIVDLIMVGVNRITVRRNLFSLEEISDIKEVTDNMIYTTIDLGNENERSLAFFPSFVMDGVVVLADKKQMERDFKTREQLKTLCNKYKAYVVETDEKNIPYWKNVGVAGVLLDLKIAKRVSRNGF